ncbi:hypothetical protein FRC11_013335 [Ceratobasidium sp. 423]|nr:hypothetical protein FRC11_013335 [Ceratobasidium sp. 423]
MATTPFNALSASLSSELGGSASTTTAPTAHSSITTHTTAVSAASLAQTVDRLAQDYGLSHESRQKLFLFAIQSNPAADSLRIFAFMLQNSEALRGVTMAIATLTNQLQTLTGLTRRDWQMAPAQEASVRAMIRNHIISSTTSYDDLNERSKVCTYQPIPLIFASVARSSRPGPVESLETIAVGLAKSYSTQFIGAPVYIQAHIAQLRLIAVDIMRVMAIPPSAPVPDATKQTKRPKHDTGFWTKVSTVFDDLVKQHGPDYGAGNGWREWEQSVIEEHNTRIQSAANLIPSAIVCLYIGPSSF